MSTPPVPEIGRGRLAGLTPFLDTLFLLIFALLSAQAVRSLELVEPVRVQLPKIEQTPDSEPGSGNHLVFTVDRSGGIHLEGVEQAFADLALMDRTLAGLQGNRMPEEIVVEIRGDRGAPYGKVVSLLQHLRIKGHTKVELLAEREREAN